jgi:Family of unknown function (DUF6152)
MRPDRSTRVFAALTAAFIWSVGLTPVFAHHSFGLFDMTKSLEIEGTVIKMEWSNPHCWLFIMTTSAQGGVPFGFEMTSVGEMSRRGWTKTGLKPGDKIKVTYHPVRDGRSAGYMVAVMTEDGRYIGRPPEGQNGQSAPQNPADPGT